VCTVSIVPTDSGFRVLHSRDELRSRSTEIEPTWRTLPSGLRACWPIDPDAGGTWVGVREDGLMLGILNLNLRDEELDPGRPPATISRGSVIPELMNESTLEDCVERLGSMRLRGMNPFRLMMAVQGDDGARVAVARFDAMELAFPLEVTSLVDPICLASSGLGDHLVQGRLPVFDELVRPEPSAENQAAFHQHQWPEHPELSVLMSRAEARTSSVTTIEVEAGETPTVLYDPIPLNDPLGDPVGAAMLQ
jgi:hypothetical protein